jgi:hypothetical protein
LLGAGASAERLPSGTALAERWAKEYQCPWVEGTSLPSIAQFLAISHDDFMLPKEILADEIASCAPPDLKDSGEPNNILANLPFSMFITTNYDNFLERALRKAGKNPLVMECAWNSELESDPEHHNLGDEKIDDRRPLIFHLHGRYQDPTSMVLTEDDYLDFMVRANKARGIIPPLVEKAISATSLLCIGYSMSDITFKVIYRGIIASREASIRRQNITVQLPPKGSMSASLLSQPSAETPEPENKDGEEIEYLKKYFQKNYFNIYWGTARDFAGELNERWLSSTGAHS